MKQFIFEIDGEEINIDMETASYNHLIIPFYRSEEFSEKPVATLINEEEFITDVNNLLPNTLKGDLFQNTMQSLFHTIQLHLNASGRLLEHDMETYVGMNILIMEAISKHLNLQVSNDQEKVQIFSLLCDRINGSMPK